MAKKYRWRLHIVSRKGDAVRDASIATNFTRRHRSFRTSHAPPEWESTILPHRIPPNPSLSTRSVPSPSLSAPEEPIHGAAFRRLTLSGFGKGHPGHGILGSTGLDGSFVPCSVHHAA